MNQEIMECLKNIEAEYDIKIIYAVEVGSRIWGYSNVESDYDIKFIYKFQLKDYISIQPPQSGIERSILPFELSGWDLFKALQLFQKSNPSLLEWLYSPICYLEEGKVIEDLRLLSKKYYSLKRLGFHYLNMARANLNKQVISNKDYIHIIRGISTVKWLVENNELPPLNLNVLLQKQTLREDINKEIEQLLKRKEVSLDFDQLLSYGMKEISLLEERLEYLKDNKISSKALDPLIWRELGL